MRRRRFTRKEPETPLDWIIRLGKEAQKIKRKQRNRFSKATRFFTLLHQNNCCNYCGMILEFPEYDHIDDDRTNNDPSNCQALCPNCHARKTRNKKNWI